MTKKELQQLSNLLAQYQTEYGDDETAPIISTINEYIIEEIEEGQK